MPDATIAKLDDYLESTRDERLRSYMDFLRIPSISALPQHAPDCRAAAEWLAADLRAIGVEHVAVEETGGHPVVYGDWLHAPDRPTALVYGHYDVQPVDPLDEWDTAPFEPTVHDNRMVARGAEDDKAQIHMHARAAEALLRTRGGLPINLKFVFEGEEESGSIHLDTWLEANKDRLGADVAVISDTSFFEGNLPAICVGLRGLMYCQIEVTGPDRDLHSGGYGGVVQNPANALCEIVAGLKGRDGRVLVPGFYDDVQELSEEEEAAMSALPFDADAYQQSLGVPELFGEEGFSILDRIGVRPTLDVNGIWGGFQGDGAKTIIPARAHAKLSCRLVPRQDPQRIFELVRDHIAAIAPRGVRVDVHLIHTGQWSLTPIDHPATKAAARAIEATFGVPPLYVRGGGSIPVSASFERILGLPVVLLGFAPPNGKAHAPNEWMDLGNYETGIRTIARYWEELAGLSR